MSELEERQRRHHAQAEADRKARESSKHTTPQSKHEAKTDTRDRTKARANTWTNPFANYPKEIVPSEPIIPSEPLGTSIDPATGQVVVLTKGGGMLAKDYTPPKTSAPESAKSKPLPTVQLSDEELGRLGYNPADVDRVEVFINEHGQEQQRVVLKSDNSGRFNFGNPIPEVGTQNEKGQVWTGAGWIDNTTADKQGIKRLARVQRSDGEIYETVSSKNLARDPVKNAVKAVEGSDLTRGQKDDVIAMIDQGRSAQEISNYLNANGVGVERIIKLMETDMGQMSGSISDEIRQGAFSFTDKDGNYIVSDTEGNTTKYIKLPDGQYLSEENLKQIQTDDKANGTDYYKIATTEGFQAMRDKIKADIVEFEKDKYKLGDGTYVLKEDFLKIDAKYRNIGLIKGYDAMMKAIETDRQAYEDQQKVLVINAEAREKALGKVKNTLDPFAVLNKNKVYGPNVAEGYDLAEYLRRTNNDKETLIAAGFTADQIADAENYNGILVNIEAHNNNLYLAMKDGLTADDLKRVYDAETVDKVSAAVKSSESSGVALPGEYLFMRNDNPKDIITLEEYKNLKGADRDKYVQTPESGRRTLINVAEFAFVPAKALKPEYTVKDVTAMEWAVGGAQLALWAIPVAGNVGGKVISGAATGIFAAEQAKHWDKMSVGSQSLAVGFDLLILTPFIGSALSRVKISTVKIPGKSGEITIWKGLDINGKPIIGITESKPVIGKGKIKLPNAADIEAGYKPITKVETTIMTDPAALRKMGIPESEIAKIRQTLAETKSFAGKKSPHTDKYLTPEEVKALNRDSVATVFKHAVENKKNVEMVYGSSTIKAQLKPELRKWRQPADIDIQLKLNTEDAAKFAEQLATKLKKTEGAGNVRISKDSPLLIETRREGQWHHAVDIHAKGEVAGESVSAIDQAAGYGWVEDLTEPALKIKYPGVGDVSIMRLSESGKRKGIAIMRWFEKDDFIAMAKKQGKTNMEISDMLDQLGAKGKERFIAPEPKRMKDISDYYVILRTFKGEETANAWAKTYGFDSGKLFAAAIKDPPQFAAWKMEPSGSAMGKAGSPSLSVVTPKGIKTSPGLSREIHRPESSASVSISKAKASPSVTVSSYHAGGIPSVNISGGLRNAEKISPAASQSAGSSSRAASTSAPRQTSPQAGSGAASRSAEAARSLKVVSPPKGVTRSIPEASVPYKSVAVSPSKSVPSSLVPKSPYPVPPETPKPPVNEPPAGILEGVPKTSKSGYYPPGTVAWKQGIGWWVVKPPYKEYTDREFVLHKPKDVIITSSSRKAAATVQSVSGTPPKEFRFDMGVVDVSVTKPPRKPSPDAGRKAIRFRPDRDGTYGGRNPVKKLRSKRQGPYYTAGGMVSRRPIG